MKILLTFILGLTLFGCSRPTVEEQYPLPWREPVVGERNEHIEIGRALVKNDITVCGSYYVRQSSDSKSAYLVGCTPDGKSWHYYVVWTYTKDVMPLAETGFESPEVAPDKNYSGVH
ncbi:MAG: hypothetical protein M3Q97_08435 [Bacteroidota bacterium]|nr:hypothetical protein [Bacteroidota bacterium]